MRQTKIFVPFLIDTARANLTNKKVTRVEKHIDMSQGRIITMIAYTDMASKEECMTSYSHVFGESIIWTRDLNYSCITQRIKPQLY